MTAGYQSVFERYEKKYMLNRLQYRQVLKAMESRMEADRYGRYTIGNIYCDTEDFFLIRTSLDKPVYKEKLRVRSYGVPGDNDPVFVEIKKKYKGIVYKRRISLKKKEAQDWLERRCLVTELIPADSPDRQIARELQWFQEAYEPRPAVYLAYDRQAYASAQTEGLRVTFDTDIRWREEELDLSAGSRGRALTGRDQVLMEIKIPGSMPFWLARTLSRLEIYPVSFSKYGTCYERYLCSRFPEETHGADVPEERRGAEGLLPYPRTSGPDERRNGGLAGVSAPQV